MIRCFCLREKRCTFGAMSLTAVICLRRDICPLGKLRIYLNFG